MHYPFGFKTKENLCGIKDALKENSRLYIKQFYENAKQMFYSFAYLCSTDLFVLGQTVISISQML